MKWLVEWFMNRPAVNEPVAYSRALRISHDGVMAKATAIHLEATISQVKTMLENGMPHESTLRFIRGMEKHAIAATTEPTK